MISLRYYLPRPDLRRYIYSYYLFESDMPVVRDLLRAALPQIRFLLAGSGLFHYADGRSQECPPAMLTGATNTPIYFDARGPLAVIGVGIMPEGWAALFGFSASEVADMTTDLCDILGAASIELHKQLLEAPDAAAALALPDLFFARLFSNPRQPPLWFTGATDAWLVGSTNPQVDQLITLTGVSARQIERLSSRIYGASPKLLARKYRALQTVVRLATGEATNWAEAAGNNYYDQSHFIRDFRQFIGMTPHRFAIDQAPVTRLSIANRRQLPDLPSLLMLS